MSVLQLRDVGHSYFGRTVLEGVDLSVERGEVVALVGPSGCGKSTLVHIAAGIIEARRGVVARHYRRHGMVFQGPRLLPCFATSTMSMNARWPECAGSSALTGVAAASCRSGR